MTNMTENKYCGGGVNFITGAYCYVRVCACGSIYIVWSERFMVFICTHFFYTKEGNEFEKNKYYIILSDKIQRKKTHPSTIYFRSFICLRISLTFAFSYFIRFIYLCAVRGGRKGPRSVLHAVKKYKKRTVKNRPSPLSLNILNCIQKC